MSEETNYEKFHSHMDCMSTLLDMLEALDDFRAIEKLKGISHDVHMIHEHHDAGVRAAEAAYAEPKPGCTCGA